MISNIPCEYTVIRGEKVMRIEIPQLITNNENVNKAFRIAISDIVASIATHKDGLLQEPQEVIYAGLGYDKPWTRDAVMLWICGSTSAPTRRWTRITSKPSWKC